MELTHDWKGFQSVFTPKQKLLPAPSAQPTGPIYVVHDELPIADGVQAVRKPEIDLDRLRVLRDLLELAPRALGVKAASRDHDDAIAARPRHELLHGLGGENPRRIGNDQIRIALTSNHLERSDHACTRPEAPDELVPQNSRRMLG